MTGARFTEFAQHVFRGQRFQGAMPVEVLPELSAYRDLVFAVARALYLENARKQRVPKGFEGGFQLVLRERVGEGSAAVQLDRVTDTTGPVQLVIGEGGGETDWFERARELIDRTIEAVGRDQSPPPEFPAELFVCFNGFGRTLDKDKDESIELRGPGKTAGVRYDRKLRKRLVLVKSPTYEDAVDVTGEVVQFDRQRLIFDLLVAGQRVSGRLDGLDDEDVRTVYTAAAVGSDLKLRVTGLGAMDERERLTRFLRIDHVQYAEDEVLKERLDIEKRLQELGALGEGWFDGRGKAFDEASLAWVATTLKAAESTGLPRPYLYPTPEGAVQAEWSFVGAEVSAEISLDSQEAHLVGVHTKTGAHDDRIIPLNTPRGMTDFVAFVTRFAP